MVYNFKRYYYKEENGKFTIYEYFHPQSHAPIQTVKSVSAAKKYIKKKYKFELTQFRRVIEALLSMPNVDPSYQYGLSAKILIVDDIVQDSEHKNFSEEEMNKFSETLAKRFEKLKVKTLKDKGEVAKPGTKCWYYNPKTNRVNTLTIKGVNDYYTSDEVLCYECRDSKHRDFAYDETELYIAREFAEELIIKNKKGDSNDTRRSE